MTTPFWCLLIVAMIPYVLASLVGYLRFKQFGKLDQHHPRVQTADLRGAGARANGAQKNAWEALAIFAAAVFVAHLAGANPHLSAVASVIFVVARFIHAAAYIADIPLLRSGVFLVGLGCCIRLFALAAVAETPM